MCFDLWLLTEEFFFSLSRFISAGNSFVLTNLGTNGNNHDPLQQDEILLLGSWWHDRWPTDPKINPKEVWWFLFFYMLNGFLKKHIFAKHAIQVRAARKRARWWGLDRFHPSESFVNFGFVARQTVSPFLPWTKEFYLDDGFEPTIELCHGQEQGGGRWYAKIWSSEVTSIKREM